MKLLPTTADSNFGEMDFFTMVVAVSAPALVALLVWAIFFRKRRRRKRRRKEHDYSANIQPISRAGGLPPVRKPEGWTDQIEP
jgi:hypothetical protein